MKNLITVILLFTTSLSFGQLIPRRVEVKNRPTYSQHSPIKVINVDGNKSHVRPTFFINGKPFSELTLKGINPELIDSMSIVKQENRIEGKQYYGEIRIKMKDGYKPKFISLADLKTKYIKQSSTASIFMIDNDLVKRENIKSVVDENNILKIEVQKINGENFDVNVIRFITRTEENIKRVNTIWSRGND